MLFEECSSELIVTSEMQLRKHINEFRDHKMIALRNKKDGAEEVLITLAAPFIQKLLDGLTSGFLGTNEEEDADVEQRST